MLPASMCLISFSQIPYLWGSSIYLHLLPPFLPTPCPLENFNQKKKDRIKAGLGRMLKQDECYGLGFLRPDTQAWDQ